MTELRLDVENHIYYSGTTEIPSITKILRARGIMESWGDETDLRRGKVIHAAIHLLNQGKLKWASIPPYIEGYVRSYERLLIKHGGPKNVIASELSLMDNQGLVAGTLDAVLWMKAKRVMVEHKSCKPYLGSDIQVAGYSYLWRQNRPNEPIDHRIILELKPDGRWPKIHPHTDPGDENVFIGAKREYYYLKKHGRIQ